MIDERATKMGFRRDEAKPAMAVIEALAAPPETFDVAMDLARLVSIPLEEATWALVDPRRLRRLGFIVPPGTDALVFVSEQAKGMAEAYTSTFHGAMAVRAALREVGR